MSVLVGSGTPCHSRVMEASVSPLVAPFAPTVGLREAARISGCSVATVRRRKAALMEHGATSTAEGWVIPIPALVAVGLLDRVSPPDTVPVSSVTPSKEPAADTPLIAQLRAELAAEHTLRLVAEARAEERGRALERADLAMRMLEAGPTPAPVPHQVPVEPSSAESSPMSSGSAPRARRSPSWWRRGSAQ